jgi:hypothetical protein
VLEVRSVHLYIDLLLLSWPGLNHESDRLNFSYRFSFNFLIENIITIFWK